MAISAGNRWTARPIVSVGAGFFRVHALRCDGVSRNGSAEAASGVSVTEDKRVAEALDAIHELPSGVSMWLGLPVAALPNAWAAIEARKAESNESSRLIVEVRQFDQRLLDDAMDSASRMAASGVRIAIGPEYGYASFEAIVALFPDYFVFGPALLEDLQNDYRRQVVLEALTLMASRLGARVVGSGVSSMEELETLTSLGIALAEGPLFGMPVRFNELAATPGGASKAIRSLFGPRSWKDPES